MKVFADYARYYNLLYRDKDYTQEAAFVLQILKKHGCNPKTLLDLGCGTGRHAVELSSYNIHITGVDISETMLTYGNESINALKQSDLTMILPELIKGDALTLRLNKTFDAVTSLFHVMSYQNTEEDVLAVMQTAKEHLNNGGLFLFDFWYGPGVLTDPPVYREKIMEDNDNILIRRATPVHRVNDNIVEVHYDISFTDKKTGVDTSLNECHVMRYWFLPELSYLAKKVDLQVHAFGAWLSSKTPDLNTWNAWILLK